MAHSSGGGSHSGGSSHSSSSSSYEGSGGSGPRRSGSYFSGARRYRYYDSDGEEQYVYMDSVPKKMSTMSFAFMLVFLLPFLGLGLGTAFISIGNMLPQKPLDKSYVSPDTHIYDTAGVMSDETELEKSLSDFEKKTGICPVVLTVDDEYWTEDYNQLVDFSLDYYNQTFSDEQHYLVVYSQPEGTADRNDVNWAWEAIQGDETDPVITVNNAVKFEKKLQNGLENNNISIEKAMTEAFDDASEYMLDTHFSISRGGQEVVFSLIWNSFVFLFLFLIIRNFRQSRITYTEVPLEGAMPYRNGYDMLGVSPGGTEVRMPGSAPGQYNNYAGPYNNNNNNGFNGMRNGYENTRAAGYRNSMDNGMPSVNLSHDQYSGGANNRAKNIPSGPYPDHLNNNVQHTVSLDDDDLARRIRESYKR